MQLMAKIKCPQLLYRPLFYKEIQLLKISFFLLMKAMKTAASQKKYQNAVFVKIKLLYIECRFAWHSIKVFCIEQLWVVKIVVFYDTLACPCSLKRL